MAANRLFQMVYLLLERGKMTAPELAEHYEVSVRTIYRDVDMLSAAGIPVYTAPGKSGGIFIQENFVLNRSLLTEEEQEKILLALQGIQMVDSENTAVLLKKLSSVFQKQDSEISWVEIDFSDWQPQKRVLFNYLKEAVIQKKQVAFTYYNGKGERSRRTVEPLKLVFKSRDWFLYAYCCMREEERLFKLNRMKELVLTEETFERKIPTQIFNSQKEAFEVQTVPLTLRFEPEMAYRVYEIFDEVEELSDKYLLVRTSMPENWEMYSCLLSYGSKVEVLEPEFVREKLKEQLEKSQNIYRT